MDASSPHFFHDYQDVPASLWIWPNFTPQEFYSRGDDPAILIVPEFMDRLQSLRNYLGFPLIITSGYRTPAYNMAVASTGKDGPHTTGRAVDISIYGDRALALVMRAAKIGFTGVGFKQHGQLNQRFIHLDDLPEAPGRPRPWIWTYA